MFFENSTHNFDISINFYKLNQLLTQKIFSVTVNINIKNTLNVIAFVLFCLWKRDHGSVQCDFLKCNGLKVLPGTFVDFLVNFHFTQFHFLKVI